MNPNPNSNTLKLVWRDQATWSEVANQLKSNLSRARTTALILGVLGAFLATLAAQFSPQDASVAGQITANHSVPAFVISVTSALALAAVALVSHGFAPKRVENWTRARSISEALKQEA